MVIHYNAALHPETHVLPGCVIGIIGSSNPRPVYHGTINIDKVTCKRCLRSLGRGGKP